MTDHNRPRWSWNWRTKTLPPCRDCGDPWERLFANREVRCPDCKVAMYQEKKAAAKLRKEKTP
jgi:DNA-directed RNA polymerase subunit RPC12/RpoP